MNDKIVELQEKHIKALGEEIVELHRDIDKRDYIIFTISIVYLITAIFI